MQSRKIGLNNFQNKSLSPLSTKTFSHNERVFHQKFGYGHIVEIDADSAVVCFDKAGNKKVKASYLFGKDNLP